MTKTTFGRAARRADRVGDEHVVEPQALARQPVDVRRRVHARPVGTDGMRRMVVGHDEDDVRPGFRPPRSRATAQESGRRACTEGFQDIASLHGSLPMEKVRSFNTFRVTALTVQNGGRFDSG